MHVIGILKLCFSSRHILVYMFIHCYWITFFALSEAVAGYLTERPYLHYTDIHLLLDFRLPFKE